MGTIQLRRVVLDTNVLVSGLLFGGVPGELVPLWRSGRIRPMASQEIIEEYLRVLSYPKFRLTESEIGFLLLREILPFLDVRVVAAGPDHIKEDPSDNKFLWCAAAGRADAIVSGDEHLLSFRGSEIPVMTPARFLEVLRKGSPRAPRG